MQAILLALLLALAAVWSVAAVPQPVPANIGGLTATGCGRSPAAVSCGGGRVVRVDAAFLGRSVPGRAGAAWKWTCPSPGRDNSTTCTLPPQQTAALTQRVARQCDGKTACAPSAVLSPFPDPCPSTSKYLLVSYSCLSAPPPPPAPYPPGTLYRRRPAAAIAATCPGYASGVQKASAASAAWAAQTAISAGNTVAFELAFVDLDLGTLDSFVRSATSNAFSLATVSSLNITAVNVRLPSNGTVRIGRNNPGFTRVTISALNIVGSQTGAIDVYSRGADVSGRFGPDVSISAAHVYGPVRVMQNGLTARHPRINTKVYTARLALPVGTQNGPYNDRLLAYGCSMFQCNPGQGPLYPQACTSTSPSGAPAPPDNTFLPVCTAAAAPSCLGTNPCFAGGTFCVLYEPKLSLSTYYGAALLRGKQNDTTMFDLALDRFTFPGFNVQGVSYPGKSKAYGRSTVRAGAFFDADGSPASRTISSEWPLGVFSTADYTIALSQYPEYNYLVPRLVAANQSPPNPYLPGELGVMVNASLSPPRQPPVVEDWYPYLNFSCPASSTPGLVSLQGTISRSRARASGFSASALSLRLAAGCAKESIASSRFSDAQAVASDLALILSNYPPAPGSGGSPHALSILSGLASLRGDRKSPAAKEVPLLSVASLQGQLAAELSALQVLAQAEGTLRNSGSGVQAALAAVEGSATQVDVQVQSIRTDLDGLKVHVGELQGVVSALNSTYYSKLREAKRVQKLFTTALSTAIKGEIADLVIKFVTDAVAIGFGDVAAAAGLKDVIKTGTKLSDYIGKAEEMAKILDGISKLISSVQALDQSLSSLVNSIVNVDSDPAVNVTAATAGSFAAQGAPLVSLSVAANNFQLLRDQALLSFSTVLVSKISYSADYAASLAEVGTAGYDLMQARIQLLSAQNQLVRDAAKLQAAKAAQARLVAVAQLLQQSSFALQQGAFESMLGLLDWKTGLMDTAYAICRAFEYQHSQPCPASVSSLSVSQDASTFYASMTQAIVALGNAFDATQCFCNATWIETGKAFIGNLSSNAGKAVLDLSNVTKPELAAWFSSFENIHIHQINLKPYGIQAPSGVDPNSATLTIQITPTGLYNNYAQPATGPTQLYSFLAKPYTLTVGLLPLQDWTVFVPGALSNAASGKYYVPTPFARFSVQESVDDTTAWDWSGVWGVQVELWGFLRGRGAGAGLGSAFGCQTCPNW